MANLYYGNGNCSVEGDIRAIQIDFKGNVELTDKTTNSFVVTIKNNRVIFYPLGLGILSDLFDYIGFFKITSVIAVDSNAELIPLTVNEQNDYTEKIKTNSEDATINIDEMNTTYTKDRIVASTLVQPTKKPNQVLANNYLSGQLTQEALDGSVETTATPQVLSISTETSY
tara:strand:+ start:1907 stop:2419 length:513 start_codon:yes stop_codon:yes gene_type:complete